MTTAELINLIIARGSIGTFANLQPIGQGAFGFVLCAIDTILQRPVALKFPRNQDAPLEYLLQEARLLAALSHPHILCIHSAQCEAVTANQELVFLVTEYVPGGDLGTCVADGVLPHPDVLNILCQIASGLAAAHRIGILHRDVKPENVLLDSCTTSFAKTTCRLADFGIATRIGASPGEIIGTKQYMAPEAWDGDFLPASDVYALGVMAYRLLSGRFPIPGNSDDELRKGHKEVVPDPIEGLCRDCPPSLAGLIHRALEKDRSKRPGHAGEFLRQLTLASDADGIVNIGPTRAPKHSGDPVPRIVIVAKNILDLGIEAVAYSANNRLEFSGGLAKEIAALAGSQLETKARAVLERSTTGSVQVGEVIVTPAFKLESRGLHKILHAATLYWDPFTNSYLRQSHEAYLRDIATAVENTCRSAIELNDVRKLGLTLFGMGIRRRLYPELNPETLVAANVQGLHRFILSEAMELQPARISRLKKLVISAFDRRHPERSKKVLELLAKQLNLIRPVGGRLIDCNVDALVISANNLLAPGTSTARSVYKRGGKKTRRAIQLKQQLAPFSRGAVITIPGGELEDAACNRRYLIHTVTTVYQEQNGSDSRERIPASCQDIYLATTNSILEALRLKTRTLAIAPMCTRPGYHSLDSENAAFLMSMASIQAINDLRTVMAGRIDRIDFVLPDRSLFTQVAERLAIGV